MDIVYFDIETQKTFNDVHGRGGLSAMRMSVGVTYSTAEGAYQIYGEDRAEALIARLLRADMVVGFSILRFDYEVLMGYTTQDLGYCLPTLDMLVEIEKAVGHRIKLEDVARATLGIGKTGQGLDAIRLFREGKLIELASYCCFDVKVTRLVHEHGARHRQLAYFDRSGARQTFPVSWKG